MIGSTPFPLMYRTPYTTEHAHQMGAAGHILGSRLHCCILSMEGLASDMKRCDSLQRRSIWAAKMSMLQEWMLGSWCGSCKHC